MQNLEIWFRNQAGFFSTYYPHMSFTHTAHAQSSRVLHATGYHTWPLDICRQPHHKDRSGSRLMSQVKPSRLGLVTGWVTAWEHCHRYTLYCKPFRQQRELEFCLSGKIFQIQGFEFFFASYVSLKPVTIAKGIGGLY